MASSTRLVLGQRVRLLRAHRAGGDVGPAGAVGVVIDTWQHVTAAFADLAFPGARDPLLVALDAGGWASAEPGGDHRPLGSAEPRRPRRRPPRHA